MSCIPFRFLAASACVVALELAPLPWAQGVRRARPAALERGDTDPLVVIEGFVFEPDGSPAEGAVVVSSAGGRAVANRDGGYRLELRVAFDAGSVQLTAFGARGADLEASTCVDLFAGSALTPAGPLWLASGGTCQPSWEPTFGGMEGADGIVRALTVYDDGGGPALYVGGEFTVAGGYPCSRIGKWDGSSWGTLGAGLNGKVFALTVHDDGNGPALIAGGSFTEAGGVPANGVARWNGSSWAPLGSGTGPVISKLGTTNWVYALASYDDGGGPALYASGSFTTFGGGPGNYIAKWDGSGWTPVGGGMNNFVVCLTVHDDGSGSALYAGGLFTTAGGAAANRIARWNGSTWSQVDTGVTSLSTPRVEAMTVYDDGSGPALYAGGSFVNAGSASAASIAKWNGSQWSALNQGVSGSVSALATYDDGSGPKLYVGGSFSQVGTPGVVASRIAAWNGTAWAMLDSQMPGADGMNKVVYCLRSFDDGSGPHLFAGGEFELAGEIVAPRIAKWKASDWSTVNSGMEGRVRSTVVHDDGTGAALYSASEVQVPIGTASRYRISKWNGSSRTTVVSGAGTIYSMVSYDDGNGPALYASRGDFGIAKWSGSNWTPISANGTAYAFAVFDDGSGPALYAAGRFTAVGGVPANNIAKWNGSQWTALGLGLSLFSGEVRALAVHDDGNGPALYAGGDFTLLSGGPGERIAKWNGSQWSALGAMNSTVISLATYDDGSGPALYAGGRFTTPGPRIAKWNGSDWAQISGGGVGIGTTPGIWSMAVYDDGSGPALYVGGAFLNAGGFQAKNIAKWDGSSWAVLGSGVNNGIVYSLTVYDDGSGAALAVGGEFTSAPDSGDSYLARWKGCTGPDTTAPDLTCPSVVRTVERLRSAPGEIVTFSVTATDDRDPAPLVVSVPPSGSFFPPGTTLVLSTATDASGNQSSCEFAVVVEAVIEGRPR